MGGPDSGVWGGSGTRQVMGLPEEGIEAVTTHYSERLFPKHRLVNHGVLAQFHFGNCAQPTTDRLALLIGKKIILCFLS